jgi:integrase
MVLQKRVIIGQADLTRIIDELERRAASADFYAMRTRAFVYLLADGVLRTNAAISLNLEDVVKDPAAKRIRVVQEAVQRPCEANRYKARKFVMTDRTRDAIAQYLEVARAEGWLPERALKGPLFIATEHRGTMQRLSQRTATSLWRTFLGDVKVGHDYQLEDIVFTARVRFLQLAKGNLDVFSEHTGLSRRQSQK